MDIGCPMYVLQMKLQLLESSLKDSNQNCFRNVHHQVTEKNKSFGCHSIFGKISAAGQSDFLLQEEKKVIADLDKALDLQARLWKKKDKMDCS